VAYPVIIKKDAILVAFSVKKTFIEKGDLYDKAYQTKKKKEQQYLRKVSSQFF
jgi:hypothetical protein